jgi:hypothetical protein
MLDASGVCPRARGANPLGLDSDPAADASPEVERQSPANEPRAAHEAGWPGNTVPMTTTPTPPIIPPDDDPEQSVSSATSADADRRASQGEEPAPEPGDDGPELMSSADADREASKGKEHGSA